jgi:hypothetical protein
MKPLFIALLFFVGGYQDSAIAPKTDIEAVLTYVLNRTELVRFTDYYVDRRDVLYFRFLASPVCSDQSLNQLKDIVIRIKDSRPLVYDEYQNDEQKPIVTVKILKMTQNTAEVIIGFPIEGAVGRFTLMKKGTWIITERKVSVI